MLAFVVASLSTANTLTWFCSVQPVNVRHLDLDAVIDIQKGKIMLYPKEPPPSDNVPEAVKTKKPAGRRRSVVRSTTTDARQPVTGARRTRRSKSGAGDTAASAAAATAQKTPGTGKAVVAKPERGTGLNVPALLTFRRMLVKNREDAAAVAGFRGKLQAHAAKVGAVFVHYEVDTGTWVMKVDGF